MCGSSVYAPVIGETLMNYSKGGETEIERCPIPARESGGVGGGIKLTFSYHNGGECVWVGVRVFACLFVCLRLTVH